MTRARHFEMPPTSTSTWAPTLLLTSAIVCPALVARASGRAANCSATSPSDQERPPFDVEINGVKVRSTEGRTPTSSDGPAEAEHQAPVGGRRRRFHPVGPGGRTVGTVEQLPERVQRFVEPAHRYGGPRPVRGLDGRGQRRRGLGCSRGAICLSQCGTAARGTPPARQWIARGPSGRRLTEANKNNAWSSLSLPVENRLDSVRQHHRER